MRSPFLRCFAIALWYNWGFRRGVARPGERFRSWVRCPIVG
ncbi:MAG: hypothetical protein VKK42_01615 [Lyngbya sp.]|nr:hypothetical protein [Lyngbya sp.]